MQTHRTKIIFKDFNINQNLLLPPLLKELVDPEHTVRIVNRIVDNINIVNCQRALDKINL